MGSFGRKILIQNRRRILVRKKKRTSPVTFRKDMLQKDLERLRAAYSLLRFTHQSRYLELINLHFERKKKIVLPDEKARIHFLFISPAFWPSYCGVFEACKSHPEIETAIVLLETEGTPVELSSLRGARDFLDKNNIRYIPYNDYDILEQNPHIIVYNYPYNHIYHYFAQFSADSVKKLGVRPVYVHYGLEFDRPRETGMLDFYHYQNYCQALAWKRFAIHKDVREGSFAKGYLGGSNVVACGHPKFDRYYSGTNKPLPEALTQKAAGRPLLVYRIHHPPTELDYTYKNRTHSLPCKETIRILRYLAKQEDFCTAVLIHPLFASRVEKEHIMSQEEWLALKKMVQDSPNTYLHEGDYQPLLMNADYFITEMSSLMIEMAFFDKPILYLYDEPAYFKPFAEDIIRSFFHGNSIYDVQLFLDRIRKGGKDGPKRSSASELQKLHRHGNISKYIAEKMINDIRIESAEKLNSTQYI